MVTLEQTSIEMDVESVKSDESSSKAEEQETEEEDDQTDEPANTIHDEEKEYEIEAVVDARLVRNDTNNRRTGKVHVEYLIKWFGYEKERDRTWELDDALEEAPNILEDYWMTHEEYVTMLPVARDDRKLCDLISRRHRSFRQIINFLTLTDSLHVRFVQHNTTMYWMLEALPRVDYFRLNNFLWDLTDGYLVIDSTECIQVFPEWTYITENIDSRTHKPPPPTEKRPTCGEGCPCFKVEPLPNTSSDNESRKTWLDNWHPPKLYHFGYRTAGVCDCRKQLESEYLMQPYTDCTLIPQVLESTWSIMECATNCACRGGCVANLVSNAPDLNQPIEFFRAEGMGWGVRALCDIKCGQYVGKFVGELHNYDPYRMLGGDGSYLTDIYNFHVLPMGSGDELLYELNYSERGNWTRMLNHSCNPNLTMHYVIGTDGDGYEMPTLALFANTDIDKDQQLFIQYPLPSSLPEGATVVEECQCKGDICTGIFRITMPDDRKIVNCLDFEQIELSDADYSPDRTHFDTSNTPEGDERLEYDFAKFKRSLHAFRNC